MARMIRLMPRCRSHTHHTSSPSGESTRSANRSVISGPGAPVSGSGLSISPLAVVRHRYSRWSAKLAKTNPSGSGRYDFPPYSCTRVLAFHGAGSRSRLTPSGPWRTTVTRPPSSGRDSCHHTPAASMTGNDRPTCVRATSAPPMGERHSP